MFWGDGRRDDRTLVARFLDERSEALFRALYRRHTPRMLGLARRLSIGGSPGPEDVVQDAWVRAVAAMPAFEWRSSLAAWLGGFVVNVVREHRRSAARRANARLEAEPPQSPEPVIALGLKDAIAALPPGFRTVLTLHDFAGLTHEEIGAALGIDPGTSKSQLARARRRVRDLLGADFTKQD